MVNINSILFFLGSILSRIAPLLLFPTLYALATGSEGVVGLLQSLAVIYFASLFLSRCGRSFTPTLRRRDMFIVTTLVWIVACGFGALPFFLVLDISFTDAFFETISGFTTTGYSILTELERIPPAILLWRSLLQWMGGVGFIVIAIAILPALGVGGMHLFHTEFSEQAQKSSPRIRDAAKQIISVYCILTLLCFFGFCLSNMSYFEAINHAFSTISTGGFSTSSDSMDHFSPWAHWNAAIFMLLGSLPLLLVVQSAVRRRPGLFWRDQQVWGFLKLLTALTTLVTLWLWWARGDFSIVEGLGLSFFNVINLMSTTGYSLGQFNSWGPLSTLLFAILPIIGGCSGSTVGGIKIFRLQICLAMLSGQLKRLVHPNAVLPQIYNHQELSDEMLRSVIALMMAFLVTIFLLALLLSISAPSIEHPLAEALSVVTNFGLKIGFCSSSDNSVAGLPQFAKWILAGGMLLGRLEIVTVMVLFSPAFWRD